eukprot:gnl/Chilomastix_cuspidata/2259.p1 GENE.gnl/Chilomastix_cuspidata/2259~~gnl/Chilomastix_cuspidata/2259.p1  ORF type:complete len:402 (-),score=104.46 gnl/Chilomastix_cuspidata/2259:373-1578(-)
MMKRRDLPSFVASNAHVAIIQGMDTQEPAVAPAEVSAHAHSSNPKKRCTSSGLLPHALLLCTRIFVSLTLVFSRDLKDIDSFFVSANRLTLSAFISLWFYLYRPREALAQMRANSKWHMAIYAGTMYLMVLSVTLGARYASALVIGVMSCLRPLFSALLAALLGVERVSAPMVAGLLVAAAGVPLMLGAFSHAAPGGDRAWLGALCMAANAMIYGVNLASQVRLVADAPRMRAIYAMPLSFAPACVLSWAVWFAARGGGAYADVDARAALEIAYAGTLGLVGHWLLTNFTMKLVRSPTVVSVYSLLQPLLTALLAYVLLGEAIAWHTALGGAVTIAGIVILIVGKQRNARKAATDAREKDSVILSSEKSIYSNSTSNTHMSFSTGQMNEHTGSLVASNSAP